MLSYSQSYLLLAASVMSKTIGVTTQLSTKGQVVLPKALREKRGWRAGETFVIEERPEGLLLRPSKSETPTRIEDRRRLSRTGQAGREHRGNEQRDRRLRSQALGPRVR